MLLAFTMLPLLSQLSLGFAMQTRILRIASMMSALPIVASLSLLEGFLQTFFPKVKMIVKVGKKKTVSFQEASILMCLALLLPLLLATDPNLYQVLLSKPGGLIRLGEESYISLMYFKATFLQHETNVSIIAAAQVASWALPIFTDFDNNIQVILMSTITNTSSLPKWMLTRVEIYDGIIRLNATVLKKYNIKYIVAILPRSSQWYDSRAKDFALKLWKTDFSSIANLIYEKTDNCTRCIKIWKINE